ncbi:hypothetical protein [Histidinibacterium aquaticum]|uniref:Lipoprotein n=1 Tax=Histidinibacterium aquaticum TaxID=2613962 RepID=A0A5J5GPR0_9RHOB|nr:hypothetical protein [Histidinibacterium aquaticum]KAA9009733.1 hypothetical protein F3S47_00205 [Histidinibacterium aquaticum]
MRRFALAPVLFAPLLAACGAAPQDAPDAEAPEGPPPVYEGIETRLLDGDLVNFRVAMRNAEGPVDLRLYAECAAAQYTLIRGYQYARHLRTNVEEEGGIWLADAVYTISPGLPAGLQTIDAAFTVETCERAGVPTV